MSSLWILLTYGLAVCLALYFLKAFHSRHWYWHVAAVVLAFGIGLTPTPENWSSPKLDLAIGSVFVFLFLWGAGAPFFRPQHH